jgi:hypothetical protein
MLRGRVLLVGLLLSAALLAQNVVTNPTGSQNIVQPAQTQLNVNNLENTIYVDQFNWSIAPGGSYSAGSNTLTFTTCPKGVSGADTFGNKVPHWVYISGGTGTPEPVAITGGTCTASGSAGGTITFTTVFSHSGAFTVSSATGGAQEADSFVRYLRNLLPKAIYSPFEFVFPQGTLTHFQAPLYMSASVANPNLDSYNVWRGGSVECDFYASCIQIGDTWQLELLNGPTCTGGTYCNTLGSVSNKFRDTIFGPGAIRWKVNPSSPSTITAGSSSVTLTIPTGPSGFYAAIPGQFLWLNGTTGGLEGTYRGTGEEVLVTGGTCANGGTNCTITIVPAEPWITTLAGHDAGYSLSSAINSVFEDNGQGTLFESIGTSYPLSSAYFGHFFDIENDQAAAITTHDVTLAYTLNSTSEFQGSILFSPGDFGHYAGIAAVEHSGFSLQCSGNAVEWYSGNGLSVSNTIIQAWNTFGSKLSMYRGGFGVVTYNNVYSEAGCTNSVFGLSGAAPDTIVNGSSIERYGSNQPANAAAVFTGSVTGQTFQVYYVVYTDGGSNKSTPVPVGYATVTNPNTNHITVQWFTGTKAGTPVGGYDLLRVTGTTGNIAQSAPIGTGNWAVATGLTPTGACNIDGACSYVDTLANGSLSSYTVPTTGGPGNGNPNFFPHLSHFGTGAVVISGTSNQIGNSDPGDGYASYYGVAGCMIAPVLAQEAIININESSRYGFGAGAPYCLASGKGQTQLFPLLLPAGNVNDATMLVDTPGSAGSIGNITSVITGRLNFGENRNNKMHDVITIADYSIDATEAINRLSGAAFRRALVANDAGVGMDGLDVNSSSMMFHAGKAIDQYIGLPSGTECGTNCYERLTASLKTFKVPLSLGSTVTQYNGLTTGGTGLAPNLGTPFNSGSLTANEPAQTVYTTAASGAGSLGNYRVCITLWPTVTGTATAIQANAIAPSGSGTVTLPLGPVLSLASLSKGGGACGALHVAASSAIQCSTTGYSGSGTYQMSCTVEQLQ